MTELTPACLRDLLAQNGITLSKRFGQNFLIDRNVLAALGKCLPEGDEIVFLEIGAGLWHSRLSLRSARGVSWHTRLTSGSSLFTRP